MPTPRTRRIVTSALTASAVLASSALLAVQAGADPGNPGDQSSALQQYQKLAGQAEQANEDLLKAREDLRSKQADLAKAHADAAHAAQQEGQAAAAENQVRGTVDRFAGASLEGARFSQLSALLTSSSPEQYLERASALDVLARNNDEALTRFSTALLQAKQSQQAAADAQGRAEQATQAAKQLTTTAQQRKNDLDGQIQQVRAALAKLSAKDRSSLNDGDTGAITAPAGAVGAVIEAAVAQRGKPYVWGATGPNSFDCSGLTQWAFRRAGISLPRTASSQYDVGTSVSRGDWQPGDLLFWGSSASSIHHVAIYVGGGQIVHAPTEGVPVQVVPVAKGGSDYFGAKRAFGG